MQHPYHVRLFVGKAMEPHVGQFCQMGNQEVTLDEWLAQEEGSGYHLDRIEDLRRSRREVYVITKYSGGNS